jgi:hypothetical protein
MATAYRAPALLAVTVLVALAGCGGLSLSDRDLRADATAVCSAANARTTRLATPKSPTAGAQFLRRGAAVLAAELRALRMLGPPSDLATRYNATLAELGATVADVRTTIAGIQHGGDAPAAFRALELELAPILVREDASWTSLQIRACISH